MAAAIVELDPLADAVGPAAEDDYPPLARLLGRRLVLVLVGRIVVGRIGLELGGAGVHRLERGHDAATLPLGADVHLGHVAEHGQLPVGEAELLGLAEQCVIDLLGGAGRPQPLLQLHDFQQLLQEPGVDAGQLVDFRRAAGRISWRSGDTTPAGRRAWPAST